MNKEHGDFVFVQIIFCFGTYFVAINLLIMLCNDEKHLRSCQSKVESDGESNEDSE
jgi:hypothetical protein